MRLRRSAVTRIVASLVLAALVVGIVVTHQPGVDDQTGVGSLVTLGDIDPTIPAVEATQSDSLIESMGILNHFMTPAIPSDQIIAGLSEIGLRYQRDDIAVSYNTYLANGTHWIERLQQLRQLGVKTLAIATIATDTPSDVLKFIHAANDTQPSTIYAIDGPNEVDFGCAPNGTTFTGNIWVQCPTNLWKPPVEAYMASLRSAMTNDLSAKDLPLYSPSLNPINFGLTSTIPSNSTHANLHYYPIYTTPWLNDSIANNIAGAANFYGPTKPVVVTEVGYPSVSLDSERPTNETEQAKILPLYYLEDFSQGVQKTFIYDYADDGNYATDHWGIVGSDSHKKEAFYAIKNMITTLKDPGVAFIPGSLRYKVTASSGISDKLSEPVSSLLLQKRDGSYYIALWQSKNTESPAPLLGGEESRIKTINVNFGSALTSVDVINVPTSGLSANTAHDEHLDNPTELTNLKIGDGAVILKVKVAAEATPTPNPNGSPTPTPSHSPRSTYSPPPRTSHRPIPTPNPTPTPSDIATPEPTEPEVIYEKSGLHRFIEHLNNLYQRAARGFRRFL